MLKKLPLLLVSLFSLSLLLFIQSSTPVRAAITSCSASVDPVVLRTNTVAYLYFTVNNTDSNSIAWVKVTAPSSDFEIFTGSASGWSRTVESPTEIIFHSGLLSSGGNKTYTVTVQTGTQEKTTADWIVQTSDDGAGSSPFACSGSTGVAISNDTTGPVISDISVSGITTGVATIDWVTDEASNSVVEYGEDNGYGGAEGNDILVTGHSIELSNLGPNTTYHYKVRSIDAVSNSSESGDNTFTTAPEPTATPTPTNTPIPTNTPTPTLTPIPTVPGSPTAIPTPVATPTPIYPTSTPTPTLAPTPTPASLLDQLWNLLVDSTDTPEPTPTQALTSEVIPPKPVKPSDQIAPDIQVTSELAGSYQDAPVFQGSASDNVAVVAIEYSVDGGQNWIDVTIVDTSDGVDKFEFTPLLQEDGNYTIVVRALDAVGNVGTTNSYELVIDRMPPRVGASVTSIGPQQVNASETGALTTVIGIDQKVMVTTTGGATVVDILASLRENSDERNVLSANTDQPIQADQVFSLVKNPATSFWSGTLSFSKAGVYDLHVRAKDGAGNKTIRDFGVVNAWDAGEVVGSNDQAIIGAKVTVYSFESTRQEFVMWDGVAFNQTNPISVGENGKYSLLVPPGKYYVQVDAPGYKLYKSGIFEVDKTTPLNGAVELEDAYVLKLWNWEWEVPFQQVTGSYSIRETIDSNQKVLAYDLINDELPFFNLPSSDGEILSTDFRGKPSVITLINSWSPQSSEQLPLLNEFAINEPAVNLGVIMIQESLSSASVLKKRGGYDVEIAADTYGEVTELLRTTTAPTHFFVDRNGTIKDVQIGVLNIQEIYSGLEF